MTADSLVAKLKTMQADARVRADMTITYVTSGIEIAEGSLGTIKEVTHGGGLVAVLWDGMREAIWTTYDGIVVLPS